MATNATIAAATARRKERTLAALRECMGMVATACRRVGISRKTFYEWCQKDEDFKQASMDITEEVGDKVESKLLQKVHDDDTAAIIFYCKTKLKKRGYVERMDITSGNEPITKVTIEYVGK